MNVRRARFLLWSTALLLSAGAAAVLAAALAWPPETPEGAIRPKPREQARAAAASADAPPLAAFEPVWRLDLRRPLYDPPKTVAAPPPPPPPPPPLAVRLVGTMVEPDSPSSPASAQAMLVTARGQVEIKQVGQMVGESAVSEGARILTITPGVVTVLYLGKELQLKIEEPANP